MKNLKFMIAVSIVSTGLLSVSGQIYACNPGGGGSATFNITNKTLNPLTYGSLHSLGDLCVGSTTDGVIGTGSYSGQKVIPAGQTKDFIITCTEGAGGGSGQQFQFGSTCSTDTKTGSGGWISVCPSADYQVTGHGTWPPSPPSGGWKPGATGTTLAPNVDISGRTITFSGLNDPTQCKVVK